MHNGDGQYAFVNTVPISASRVMFGVLTNGWPYGWLKKGLCSSLIKTITLERAGAAAAGTIAALPRNSRREIMGLVYGSARSSATATKNGCQWQVSGRSAQTTIKGVQVELTATVTS
jgi:hypothetical protein